MFDLDALEQEPAQAVEANVETLPEMPASPWIGMYRRNPTARIRLFVALGVGTPASTYLRWVSMENYAKYPGVEVVVLELPGHGENPPPAFHSATECAKAIAETIEKLQFEGQREGDGKRPFALFGFSMGAQLMWDVARRVRSVCGDRCQMLYVGGRAGPHVWTRGTEYSPGEPTRPNLADTPTSEIYDMCITSLRGMVNGEQHAKYERYLKVLLMKDPDKLVAFGESMFCDSTLSSRGIDAQASDIPLKLECPIHFYTSDTDSLWPISCEGDSNPHACYADLLETWSCYAPCEAAFTSTIFEGLSHGEMGAPESPVFEHMMEDLRGVLSTFA